MKNTHVKDLMETHPVMVSPRDTLLEASRKMKSANCGCLPVGTEKKIEGFITDRDIVVRAVAAGEDPAQSKVSDYMTTDIKICAPDDTLADAADKMREHGVGRLVVKDDNDMVTGILTFGRILRNHDDPLELTAVVASVTGKRDIFHIGVQ